jgi:hypothetical protein
MDGEVTKLTKLRRLDCIVLDDMDESLAKQMAASIFQFSIFVLFFVFFFVR